MNQNRWIFDRARLEKTPSRLNGINRDDELHHLQETADFIQNLGRKLTLPLLCINTAVIFTQRFYVFHSLTTFEKFNLGAAALFLAAKVEEHPRPLEHILMAMRILGIGTDIKDADLIDDLLLNEKALLQTFGFGVHVQHPHQHVLRLCDFVDVSKDLSQHSYVLATHCLHLTQMCLMYKPTVIACMCIHIACNNLKRELPISREGKIWYSYLDDSVNDAVLEKLANEFLTIYSKCPAKFKVVHTKSDATIQKQLNQRQNAAHAVSSSSALSSLQSKPSSTSVGTLLQHEPSSKQVTDSTSKEFSSVVVTAITSESSANIQGTTHSKAEPHVTATVQNLMPSPKNPTSHTVKVVPHIRRTAHSTITDCRNINKTEPPYKTEPFHGVIKQPNPNKATETHLNVNRSFFVASNKGFRRNPNFFHGDGRNAEAGKVQHSSLKPLLHSSLSAEFQKISTQPKPVEILAQNAIVDGLAKLNPSLPNSSTMRPDKNMDETIKTAVDGSVEPKPSLPNSSTMRPDKNMDETVETAVASSTFEPMYPLQSASFGGEEYSMSHTDDFDKNPKRFKPN